MRLLLTFIIFILGGFYTFGKENCCEQCCEYLGNCCKKGKGEVQEEFYLKKSEATDSKEIGKLVSSNWYNNREKGTSFFLYEKIDGAGNQDLNNNDGIQVTKDKNGFIIDKNFISEKDNNTQKWALFEIIYKKKGEEEENKENEEETKYLYCSDIESIGNFGIFSNCQQHSSISVIACDTSGVTDMSDMFYDCSSLTKLNLSKFDTKNVTDMSFMFFDCSSLTELDLSNFNIETVTDMCAMFSGCASLQQLDLTNFNTENVTDMDSMFSDCRSLTELDLSIFDTKNVTDMGSMFWSCNALIKIIFGDKFNTDNVTNMSCMFATCENLKNLDLSKFDTKNVTNMSFMFSECASLQTVTFNKNLNKNIIKQLNDLGLMEVEEEENKITLKKNN